MAQQVLLPRKARKVLAWAGAHNPKLSVISYQLSVISLLLPVGLTIPSMIDPTDPTDLSDRSEIKKTAWVATY